MSDSQHQGNRILFWANLAMILTVICHDIDHVRQAHHMQYHISAQLWLVNVAVYVPSLIALALTLAKRRGAAIATSVSGLLVALSFAEVHLWRPTFPVWGLWNKNFFMLGADHISWTMLFVTVVVGVAVAMAGSYVKGLQRRLPAR